MLTDIISVIIPFYKTKKDLFIKCIESVINQSYKNLEIIVVDDGSGPEYADLLKNVSEMDDRIQCIICEQNKGLSAARNKGIEVCNGNYIVFVDSDDMLNTYAVEQMMIVKNETNADIVIGNLQIINSSDYNISEKKDIEYQTVTTKECIVRMLTKNGFGATACGRLMSKKLWEDIRFIEGILHEDMASTWEVFLKAKKICWIKNNLYYYYQGDTSSIHSSNVSEKFVKDYLFALNRRNDGLLNANNGIHTIVSYSYILNCPEIFFFSTMIGNNDIAKKYRKESVDLFIQHYKDGIKCKYISSSKRIKLLLFRICPYAYCLIYRIKRTISGLRY